MKQLLQWTQAFLLVFLTDCRQPDGGELPPIPQRLPDRTPRPLPRAIWGHWSSYGPCSRTCGQGVKMRTRDCLQWTGQRYSETHLTACSGINIDYKLCELGKCSRPDEDFRAYQCRILSKTRQINGNIHIWKPHNEGKACELTCKAVGKPYLYNFGTVQDGTPCLNSKRHICVHGQCKLIGCDGHIGASSRMDMCGVCNGRNDTCHQVRSTYKVTLPDRRNRYRGYNEVVVIPRGATNVHVSEASRNSLALMNSQHKFILNGHYTMSKPGMYNIDGTMVTYGRAKDGFERLQSDGPTTQQFYIMLYYREHNTGVDYEYWVPGNVSESDVAGELDNSIPVNDVTIEAVHDVTTTPAKETTPEVERRRTKALITAPPTPQNPNLSDDEIWDMVVKEVQRRKKNKKQKKKRVKKLKTKKLDKRINATKEKIKRKKEKAKRKKEKKRKFLKKEKCGTCKKVRNRNKQFCASDFVSKVRVNGVEIFGNATRYDITILYTYRNIVPLLHREYLWVYNLCKCPRLRLRREYIVMGMMEYHGKREIRLSLSPSSFVRQFTFKYNIRMEKLKRKRSKCKVQKKRFK